MKLTPKQLETLMNQVYTIPLNDIEDFYDKMAWDMGFPKNTFKEYANNEKNRYDLRGLAARAYTQSLYPKMPWPDFPQTQTPHKLTEGGRILLKVFANSSERLVCLGILEALERVSDFDMTRSLFENHPDKIVQEQARQFLSEQG